MPWNEITAIVYFALYLLIAIGINWSIEIERGNTIKSKKERNKPMKNKSSKKLSKNTPSSLAMATLITIWAALTSHCGSLLP
jgi:preprotein translocase subunit SecF